MEVEKKKKECKRRLKKLTLNPKSLFQFCSFFFFWGGEEEFIPCWQWICFLLLCVRGSFELKKKKPFCDGSHKKIPGIPFEPVFFNIRHDRKYKLCGCKHTNRAPFCDKTHLTFRAPAERELDEDDEHDLLDLTKKLDQK